jgi:hypothetical protein
LLSCWVICSASGISATPTSLRSTRLARR